MVACAVDAWTSDDPQDATVRADANALSGNPREQVTYQNATSNTQVSGVITDYTVTQKASYAVPGGTPTSNFVGASATQSRVARDGGRPDLISSASTQYDPDNTLPTKVTDGLPVYQTTGTKGYDALGRVTSSGDALGRVTTSTYTPAATGPLTQLLVKQPAVNNFSGTPVNFTTTTTYRPEWGVPAQTTDVNGKVTELAYDALGRLTGVWLPSQAPASTKLANTKYSYTISNTAPSTIRTSRPMRTASARTATSRIVCCSSRAVGTSTTANEATATKNASTRAKQTRVRHCSTCCCATARCSRTCGVRRTAQAAPLAGHKDMTWDTPIYIKNWKG